MVGLSRACISSWNLFTIDTGVSHDHSLISGGQKSPNRGAPGIKEGKHLLFQPVMVPDAHGVSRGTVNEGLCFRSL